MFKGKVNIMLKKNNNLEQKINKNLNNIVETIKNNYNPEKIILFGSLARGEINQSSDIDLLIIKNTSKPRLDRIDEITQMCSYDVAFDPVIFTPEELALRKSEGDFFIQDILKQGKVLYAK